MQIRPGLHRIEAPLGERFVALYLLIGSAGALLVDTGIRSSITDTLLPYLEANDIDLAQVRWAINTHCDFDHTGGNGALKHAIPSVELLVHGLDRELTENLQRLIDVRYGEFRASDGFDDPPETTAYLREVSDLVAVDRIVADGETVDLGDRVVTILHVPGHSPGHTAVHDPANRALIIGDAVLGESVLYADGRPAFPPTYRDTQDYTETIDLCRSLDAELLLTAHYPVYEGAAVAGFLDDSAAYVARIDEILLSELRRFARPVTTLELIRSAGLKLGPWEPGALDYAIFPVVGNLERLERRGVVRSSTTTGLRQWEVQA